MNLLINILSESWSILLDSAPYVLLGLLVAGTVKAFLPDTLVTKHLGRKSLGSVLKASLMGVPLPLCSCGAVPAAVALHKQGASKGAASAFLVSAPGVGVDSIALTWALLDPVMTVARPLGAFLTATVTGLGVNMQPETSPTPAAGNQAPNGSHGDSHEHGRHACCGSHHAPAALKAEKSHAHAHGCGCGDAHGLECVLGSGTRQPLKQRLADSLRFIFDELVADIGPWLLVGIGIAATISVLIPAEIMEQYLGSGILPMLVMLGVGLPIFICATSATPVAAALVAKGLSPGAALVFLLAGPVTSAATLTVLGKAMGKRVAAVYLASIAIVSLILGLIVDWLYLTWALDSSGWIRGTELEESGLLALASAVLLLVLVARTMLPMARPSHARV